MSRCATVRVPSTATRVTSAVRAATQITPALLAATLLLSAPARADEIILPLAGEAPTDGPDHFLIPFDVPEGIVEIEVRHTNLVAQNVLDWGLYDPTGFRGWGGGNAEPAVVGVEAASRSYLAGPISAGTWHVVVGKAQIKTTPAAYTLEIVLRDAGTLAPQPERAPHVASPPLATGPRWYAGDFHVHSMESGDARPPLDEIATFARKRGLDFVEITDHNTTSQLDFFNAAQARHPDLLFVPGVEFTTYDGHANGVGATRWVDHKIGLDGVTIEGAARAFADQGAIFSINHPMFDVGDLCIGCAWAHDLGGEHIGAVEIASGGLSYTGNGVFTWPAIAFWDALCARGLHVAALGGSDDHRAGVDLGLFQSPIGDPTTLVFAEELSVAALLDGIRKGRTVVKLQGPDDPMIELASSVTPTGDTIFARSTTFQARVSGGIGAELRFVHNGQALDPVPIDTDPFVGELKATDPGDGEDRFRAEVLVNGQPRTVTSHLWLRTGTATDPLAPGISAANEGGCGCTVPGRDGPPPPAGLLALSVVVASVVVRAVSRHRPPSPGGGCGGSAPLPALPPLRPARARGGRGRPTGWGGRRGA
ncbi:uncharacterized protein CMC5_016340 [Chondromyces crocatus]|uniref:Polymerase/histidinol phosphatase N-terminal domain-containing protein n=1 Tax=Chondromyces crocatus TaxID=52 RepID=A0A0K1EA81_CHOCO|nr:CehA/McbA family metallohydrolase [Chondromyces crocatus]AKT37493.1 uncharacterized protein CMC5_016340 [Chondromyces crocatus]